MSAKTSASEIGARNQWIVAVVALINIAQFFAIPALIASGGVVWSLALIPVALSTPTLWALIHEAVHGHLFADRAWNDRGGRLLSVMFGAPFQLLRFGHLMHHRFNRSPINRIEVVEEAPSIGRRVSYFGTLFGGLYVGEVIASLLAVLPGPLYRAAVKLGFGRVAPDGRSMFPAAERQLLSEPGRTHMRVDGALVLLILGTSFWLYGPYWWALLSALLARALLVSFLDNAYHYGNDLDDPAAGYNLRLPRFVARMILNYNYHEVHHAKPMLAWTELSDEFDRSGRRFEGDLLPVALRQLRGPLRVQEFLDPDADLYGLTGERGAAGREGRAGAA